MSCASLQWGSGHSPETFFGCKESQKWCCWGWLHFTSLDLVPGLSFSFTQYVNISASWKSHGRSPCQLGISARRKLGFAGTDAHLQHRNLGSRLHFQWCLRQFWRHVERSDSSWVICFLICFFMTLLLRSLWSIRLITLQTSNFQGGPYHFFLPGVACEMMSSPLLLIALWSPATREATQWHKQQHGVGRGFWIGGAEDTSCMLKRHCLVCEGWSDD